VYIRAQNPCCTFPLLTLGHGGRVPRGKLLPYHYKTDGWKDGTNVVELREMPVGAAKEMKTSLTYVRVQRLKDTNDYIVFQVDLM
jgi:hypothetical protein